MTVRDPSALDTTTEPSTGVSALLNDLDRLKVVLSAGRFEEAEGFVLSDDRRLATFSYKEPDRKTDSDQPAITLRLSWKGVE
jgi:hypothetical protein